MTKVFGPKTASFPGRVRSGDFMLGTTLYSVSSIVCEAIASAGFDFLIADTEHAPLPIDSEVFQSIVLGCLLYDLPLIVRLVSPSKLEIQRVLDSGAAGIMLSSVSDPEIATFTVTASRMPPEGNRGASPIIRPAAYWMTGWDGFRTGPMARPLVGVLIEDERGLARVDDILATGVDMVWFGPWDFQMSTGLDRLSMDERQARTTEALDQVAQAARRHGKAMVAVAFDAASGKRAHDLGASMLVATSDLWLFGERCRQVIAEVREAVGEAAVG